MYDIRKAQSFFSAIILFECFLSALNQVQFQRYFRNSWNCIIDLKLIIQKEIRFEKKLFYASDLM